MAEDSRAEIKLEKNDENKTIKEPKIENCTDHMENTLACADDVELDKDNTSLSLKETSDTDTGFKVREKVFSSNSQDAQIPNLSVLNEKPLVKREAAPSILERVVLKLGLKAQQSKMKMKGSDRTCSAGQADATKEIKREKNPADTNQDLFTGPASVESTSDFPGMRGLGSRSNTPNNEPEHYAVSSQDVESGRRAVFQDKSSMLGDAYDLETTAAQEMSGPLDLRCRHLPKYLSSSLNHGTTAETTVGKPAHSSHVDFADSSHAAHTPMQADPSGEVYHCHLCDKSFTHQVFLDIHKRTHHNGGHDCTGLRAASAGGNEVRSSVGNSDLFNCAAGASQLAASAGTSQLNNAALTSQVVDSAGCSQTANPTGGSRVIRRRRRQKGEKPYHCEVCGKCFARSTHLTQHKRVHSGEKPYSCDVCGKSFARGVHLTDHKRIHSGERPYICGICGKDFAQKSHLTQHIRLHTGEKPYQCDGCEKSFADSSTLNRHRKKHFREKMVQDGMLGTVVQK